MENSYTELLDGYAPSAETVALVKQTSILLLVGISGAGKDTIKHKLLETGKYHHIVSHTTRAPRENHGVLEQDGLEYHFITHEQAADLLRAGAFVEAKQYGDNIYGTSAVELERAHDAGKIATTDIEVQGVAEYKAISEYPIAVFILPPNYDEWQRRLLSRYGSAGADPADIAKRTNTAVQELEHALETDYYHFVINDDLDRAVTAVDKIAHAHDTFNEKDLVAEAQARELLAAIRQNLAL